MSDSLPSLEDVETAVRQAGLGVEAPELHGSLCGWLAGGAALAPEWPAQVMADPALPPVSPGSVLEQLGKASAGQLDDREFGFELLMPGSDASLVERSGALFGWCRGFLGGFGLSAGSEPPLSEEGREALADLARLAAATPQDDGDQDDEDALAEIEEFVRIAALLLHGDCALGPRHRNQLH
jgi:uncharacterized protein YgfB (UPF0149 family)